MKSSTTKKIKSLLNGTESRDELLKKFEELQNEYNKLETEIDERKAGKEFKSIPRSEKLIEALNSAIFSLQTTHTREEVFRVVAGELKNMDMESLVMTASDDLKYLSLEYFSFQTKLIKAAEKVAKMTIGQLKLNIQEIKEYEDVLVRRKTVFVKNTVEFVKRVLPKNLKFMAGQLIKSLKISNFILAPLIVENKVIGIFSVQANDLLESDISEVTMFAHQLAGIWNKVELLENANKEIAERKLAEKKLNESTRKINTLINNLPGAVYRCLNDKDWTMEYISDGIQKLTGYPASDFIGNKVRSFNSIIITEDQESVWEEVQKDLKENISFTLEYKIRASSGKIRWVLERGVGIYEKGYLSALEGYITDITEKKIAEDELNRSEKRFSLFFNQSLDGYYFTLLDEPVIWNEKTDKEKILDYAHSNQRIVEINDAMLNQYGTTRESLIGKPVSIFFEHETESGRKMRRKLFDEGRLHVETYERKFDGTPIWIEGDYICLYDEKNRITGTFGIQRDITERKKAEEAIREYAEKIEGILRVAPAGIGIVKERILTEVNPYICELTEYSRNELIGKNSKILYPSQDEYDFVGREKYNQIKERGTGYVQTRWKKKSGEIINILLASTPLDINDISKGVIFTALDITNRIRAEEALSRSEAKYKALFQNSALAIGLRATDGLYMEFNEAYSKMLGYSNEELKTLSQEDITHPEDIGITKKRMKLISDYCSDMERYEKRYIHKNGSIIWGEVCIQPLFHNDGKISAVIGTVVDITKRKLAEMSLKESEQSLTKQKNAIASLATNEVVISGDIEKAKMILTETASEILNVARAGIWLLSESEEEMISLDLYDSNSKCHTEGMALRAKNYPKYFKALRENSQISATDAQNDYRTNEFTDGYLIQNGITSMLDSVLINKDGIIGVFCFEHVGEKRTWYPHEESFANNMASLFVKTLTVAENKKAEKEISMLANAMKSINECVSITDIKNNIIFVNRAFLNTYGYEREEIIGKNITVLGSDKNPEGIHDEIHSLAIKGLWQGELINKKKDGTEFPIYLSSATVFDREGKAVAYIGVSNDITIRKQEEETLRNAKEKAEEMNRVKSSFLANMSHEVRTPLVAILGFSEVLSDIVKEPQIKNYVEMIHAGGVRLLDTLNLILDLSVIESQKVNIKLNPVDIFKEVKDAAALFIKFADKKNLSLSVESPFENLVFDTDEKIIRQILNNLINNAIKYTSNGGVTVSLGKEQRNKKFFISIRVEDTGIGIPLNKQDLIWDEFRQVSEGFNRSFEGAGLGLSITKKFVEKLGGEITLEKSEVDIGSVFKVLFPVDGKIFDRAKYIKQKKSESSENTSLSVKGSLLKLLYVDDDPISLEIVTAFTKDLYCVDTALNGREGIEKSKSRNFDALLIDINLGSDMDGMLTLKLMRELKNNRDIPAVAVTAFAMKGDREKFLSNGFTHYLSKPFDRKDLLKLLEEVFKHVE